MQVSQFASEAGGLALAKGIQDERYRSLIQTMIDARTKAGLSQAAFAKKIGRRQQFVSKYETGERRLDAVELIDLALALGLDPLREFQRVVMAQR